MKKTIKKEVCLCDKCEKEDVCLYVCMACKTEMCHECKKKHAKSYGDGVYFTGSHEGVYCNPCDAKLTTTGTDKRHNAYRAIKSLNDEQEAWRTDFEKRRQAAEDALETLTIF